MASDTCKAEGQGPLQESMSLSGRKLDEFICIICQEYLTDPVTIECGHNFCQGCITQRCAGAESASCPQCGESFQKRAFRPNTLLGSLVQHMRQMQKRIRAEEVCVEHGKVLGWFCMDDGKALCDDCKGSPSHCDHMMVPMAEAAFENKDIRSTLSRCETGPFQPPEEISPELDMLPTVLERARGKSPGAFRQATVTLDPDTVNSQLALSEDGKYVIWDRTQERLPDNPERFDTWPYVLGREGFTSGRHCWEVEVGDGRHWAVGVARESVSRKGWIRRIPKEGIWAVERWESQFRALTSPLTPLHLIPPSRIRVCLDCGRGQVRFIDADTEAPIFTFPPGSLPRERIRPWLGVWVGSPVSLCS